MLDVLIVLALMAPSALAAVVGIVAFAFDRGINRNYFRLCAVAFACYAIGAWTGYLPLFS